MNERREEGRKEGRNERRTDLMKEGGRNYRETMTNIRKQY